MQKRAALVFLPAFPAYAISRFENRLSGGDERIARVLRRLPSILDVISEMNLAAFYFRGVYYGLVNRILGVRNVGRGFPPAARRVNTHPYMCLDIIDTRKPEFPTSIILALRDSHYYPTLTSLVRRDTGGPEELH